MSALDALSTHCGIVDSFVDARGATRHTSAETRRALLAAMGVAADDDEAARRALDTLRAEDAQRSLPPVHVHHRPSGPLVLAVNGAVEPARRWRLELEDGGVHEGVLQAPAPDPDPELIRRCSIRIEAEIPFGYHTLSVEADERGCLLIVSPGRCWLPDAIETNHRLWGVAAQLYLLRSEANWGIGDYGDLKHLVQALAARGADVVGLNPLHALFPDDPEQASPYSPASRLLLNVLNIDVAGVMAAMDCEAARAGVASESFQQALARCRAASLVDYSGVMVLKLPVLRQLFDCCDRAAPAWRAFLDFRASAGAAFERSCVFLALRAYFAADSPERADWHRWPGEYARADSAATFEFARTHAEAVTFQAWLQFIADRQLQDCAEAGSAMAVGLYRDLAVGAARGGAETWANATAVVDSVHVGAPPDIYNPQGQDWGLPPFHPGALRKEGYRSFIDLLRANMRHAGALRIDHVMALQQLYWVPHARAPSEGAYVRYPLEDLIGILALESHRHRCLVVGEDLGTVPRGFRERMERARVLSYRVLFFEKNADAFIEPERYPRLALAVAGSHDLPTLRAWWQATDLALKERLHLYPSPDLARQATQERVSDRRLLEALLRKRRLLGAAQVDVEHFVEAAHALLASTRAAVTMLQLDDLTGELDPVNVPTTFDEHPNWRRRLSVGLEQLMTDSRFVSATATLGAERGSTSAQARAGAAAGGEAVESVPVTADAPWTGTYRLQVHKEFTLDDARGILPYLSQLHISHVYLSPCLQAALGSKHGYDVTDATVINPELGGEAAWRRFVDATHAAGMKILLDIVPNHMATSARNPWWDDTLARGPFSPFAGYFDIRRDADAAFQIHLCTLARAYGEALKAGELTLTVEDGRPRVKHFDNSWPLCAASWGGVLMLLDSAAGGDQPCFAELIALRSTPQPTAEDHAAWTRLSTEAGTLLERTLAAKGAMSVSSLTDDPAKIDAILKLQFYSLHDWQLSAERTNYRRFFEVDSLIGMRTELPAVMRATHARIERMIEEGDLDGLRIDHPDGLRDPHAYFDALRTSLPQGRIYIEKILDNDEQLPREWPVDGTVGYDFLAKVNRLWMDDSKIDALTAAYSDFTGHSVNIGALVRQKQREILESSFYGDVERAAQQLLRLARSSWNTEDLSARQLREALARITTMLPIYRTYRTGGTLRPADERVLSETLQVARMSTPRLPAGIFDFLQELLTRPSLTESEADFVLKWQQLTPAIMAKGVEDTTFYCFDRLLSCNEVGASASLLGISSEKFHEYCHYLGEYWPRNLLATSTHDNKRSEDVRTRISLLSEIPELWTDALHRWSQMNDDAWRNRTPDRHAEYLLYQTLIGAWPISLERCWEYLLKASREAKIHTSWHQPNGSYEEKLKVFTEGVFNDAAFITSLEEFVRPLIKPGRINSLAQTLIKMTAPGVPDFYQGSELWDLSLVDPDNRRPVDYRSRQRLLQACDQATAGEVMREMDSGLPKIWMIQRLLQLRAQRPGDFGVDATYQPLVARGAHLGNLLAYRRGTNLLIVVPRLGLSIDDAWDDTSLPLPKGSWVNLFTGRKASRSVRPGKLFADFPVAVLIRAADSQNTKVSTVTYAGARAARDDGAAGEEITSRRA